MTRWKGRAGLGRQAAPEAGASCEWAEVRAPGQRGVRGRGGRVTSVSRRAGAHTSSPAGAPGLPTPHLRRLCQPGARASPPPAEGAAGAAAAAPSSSIRGRDAPGSAAAPLLPGASEHRGPLSALLLAFARAPRRAATRVLTASLCAPSPSPAAGTRPGERARRRKGARHEYPGDPVASSPLGAEKRATPASTGFPSSGVTLAKGTLYQ